MTDVLSFPILNSVIIYITKESDFKNDFPNIPVGFQQQTGRHYIYGIILEYSITTDATNHAITYAMPQSGYVAFVSWKVYKEYEKASSQDKSKYISQINKSYL